VELLLSLVLAVEDRRVGHAGAEVANADAVADQLRRPALDRGLVVESTVIGLILWG
jgi:hypothetical protein